MREQELARCVIGGTAALIYTLFLIAGFRFVREIHGDLGTVARFGAVIFAVVTAPSVSILLLEFVTRKGPD